MFRGLMAALTMAVGSKITEMEYKNIHMKSCLRKKNAGGCSGGQGPMAMPRRWAKGKINSYRSMLTEKMIATRGRKINVA